MRALISLGTNTSRFLVVRDVPGGGVEQVEHDAIGTRLGEGLRDRGPLAPAAVERNLAVVRTFAARARERGASLCAIATSALRRADDADAFATRVREIAGVPLAIISGALEAEASYRGATYGARAGDGRVAVLDIGGGSTECAVGSGRTFETAVSLELGSVRVSERHPDLLGGAPGAPARAAAAAARIEIRALVADFVALCPVEQVRCVAGTPLTLAAVAARSDVARVTGSLLSLATLDATVDRLLDLALEARRTLPGMLPQRADVLAGGGLILSEALRALGADTALLEENDLLLGYLLMQRPAATTE